MRLRPWREAEPELDRTHEWADLLRCFRTRSSPELQRTLYHREARRRRQVREAFETGPAETGGGAVLQGILLPPRSGTAEAEPIPPPAKPKPEPRPLTYEEQLKVAWGVIDQERRDWREAHGDDCERTWSFL